MRRGPGLVALDRSARSYQKFSSLSNELNETKLAELRTQVDQFAASLRDFASAHRQDIHKDPHFRQAFQRMCGSIGVDPLAGHPPTSAGTSRLGKIGDLWNDVLGLCDWNCELGVQIVDVCVSSRARNGGLIALTALKQGVLALRYGAHAENAEGLINDDDILRSIKALRPLGCGYEVVALNGYPMVRTTSKELSMDAYSLLTFMSANAPRDHAGVPYIERISSGTPSNAWYTSMGWEHSRANCVIENMLLADGTLWVDRIPHPRQLYSERFYSPSLLERI